MIFKSLTFVFSPKTFSIRSVLPFLTANQSRKRYFTIVTETSKLNSKRIFQNLQITICCKFRYNHFKAAVVKEFGEKVKIDEVKSQKKLKEHEVRVRVHNCALNVADALLCSGDYEIKPKLPFIPGYEFAGEVLELGSSVSDLSKGDRVIGLNKETFSSLAEECVALSQDLWKIPSDVPYAYAAALADSYTTVLIASRRVNLTEGDSVLVTAAAGGLGLAGVDIAANLFKTKVIGACDTEDKASLLRDKGAFSAINYNKKEITDAVMNVTNGQGVKVVFDAVGGDIFEDCLHSIAPEGSIVILGFASRKVPKISTSELLPRSCALIGVSLTHYRRLLPEVYRHTVQEVIDMYLDDFIEPQIVARFGLEDVNSAIKFIEERKSTGKVIIDVIQ